VEKPEELAPAVERAIEVTEEDQPAVLEIITTEDTDASIYWS
jgi:acetolactate synthase-1/2/3 large subunit